jgi:hypothetical protein
MFTLPVNYTNYGLETITNDTTGTGIHAITAQNTFTVFHISAFHESVHIHTHRVVAGASQTVCTFGGICF